ncbi:hypothetical protein SAMN06296036_122116 [Pseudobacteriovorax antillogorgiicola]|uniref:Uncharacterized protein n=2 Tax=Pseudobacteriovorax antillogorgiicola TaxID=1513793 RepID=A0A1Y6CH99_9BACT|nr:hypothetical protein EDD56_122116 [Pseudobacteriovorax antillogorgiicola]SMF65203.1 hypothetical protein SAMN06296036_122116 [Pseudobacteriovorax antillogorgiicola]
MACDKSHFDGAVKDQGSTIKSAEETVADEELVVQPTPVTGAYLSCQELSDKRTTQSAAIGCRIEGNDEVNPDSIDITWQVESDQTVTVENTGATPEWLQTYRITVRSPTVTSRVRVSAQVDQDLNTNIEDYQTTLLIVWDGCSLPLINFEDLGQTEARGTAISTQFLNSHGIQLSTASGLPLQLAEYGSGNPRAYVDNRGRTNGENEDDPEATGDFFMTEGLQDNTEQQTIYIDYTFPTKEARFELIDVDSSEYFLIRAMDSNGITIDQIDTRIANIFEGDARLSRYTLSSPTGRHEIYKIELAGFKDPSQGDIGFGFDNLSPHCLQ